MEMPAGWAEALDSASWTRVLQTVEDYGPVLEVLRSTWSNETLREMAEGKVFVPDDMLNDALKRRLTPDGNVTDLTLRGEKGGRLFVRVETRAGAMELSGEVKEFVHHGDTSYMVYRVREKNIPNHGLLSWVFSRISLSMAERMVGRIEAPEGLPVRIRGNTVRVDYGAALAESDFGRTRLYGHRLIDMVEIERATPKEGGIEFDTKLHVPDDVKAALSAMLKEKLPKE